MILLPKEQIRDGYLWRYVDRRGNWALYEQIIDTDVSNWNVFKVLRAKDGVINGRPVFARELFPSPSIYGIYAWNFQNKHNAVKLFEELTS